MNSHRLFLFRTTFSLIILALLPGCVSNRPYRLQGLAGGIYEKKFPGQQPPTQQYQALPGRNYQLSFVEFDEKGDFWDRVTNPKSQPGPSADAPSVSVVAFHRRAQLTVSA